LLLARGGTTVKSRLLPLTRDFQFLRDLFTPLSILAKTARVRKSNSLSFFDASRERRMMRPLLVLLAALLALASCARASHDKVRIVGVP
jgi:hypothetical protein